MNRGFIILPIILISIAVLIVGGGAYLYIKGNQGDADRSALVSDLASSTAARLAAREAILSANPELALRFDEAQSNVQSAVAALDDLVQRSDMQQAVISNIQDQYAKVKDAVDTLSITTKDAVIETKLAQIESLLKSWNSVMADSSTMTLSAVISVANRDAVQIQTYVHELEVLVGNLTPANSGITQAQIDAYKKEVAEIVQEVAQAVVDMKEVASSTTTTNTPDSTPIIIQQQVQAQQEVVNHAIIEQAVVEQEIVQIQNNATSSSSGTVDPGDQFIEPDPLPEDNSADGPKLIEGANKL